ncbi:hypothetical protein DMJ13_27405 [halophilic archaeon]|nr:hypothetical protein DMJ13_27405 [halophilic archaeon]
MAASAPTPETVTETLDALEDRDVRALTEMMVVVDRDVGRFDVYSASGENRYHVEGAECDCPDAEYRAPDGRCKHVRRVEFRTGARPLPEGVVEDALDETLRSHLAAEGRL